MKKREKWGNISASLDSQNAREKDTKPFPVSDSWDNAWKSVEKNGKAKSRTTVWSEALPESTSSGSGHLPEQRGPTHRELSGGGGASSRFTGPRVNALHTLCARSPWAGRLYRSVFQGYATLLGCVGLLVRCNQGHKWLLNLTQAWTDWRPSAVCLRWQNLSLTVPTASSPDGAPALVWTDRPAAASALMGLR